MAYLTCDALLLGYDKTAITDEISFAVQKGDYLFILGENGAGKSTLMKTLLQLIPPLSGTITTDDGLTPYEIGYLPQQTVVQRDFPATVWEIVLSGTLSHCKMRPFYSKREKQLAQRNLERMGISHLKRKCYRNLSGGQQQRVLLARALCATTKLLVLDEPVTGLDPKATTHFYEMIQMLNQEGISVIMVSHDVSAAIAYGSHILHIEKKQTFYGTKEEYLKSNLFHNFQRNSEKQEVLSHD